MKPSASLRGTEHTRCQALRVGGDEGILKNTTQPLDPHDNQDGKGNCLVHEFETIDCVSRFGLPLLLNLQHLRKDAHVGTYNAQLPHTKQHGKPLMANQGDPCTAPRKPESFGRSSTDDGLSWSYCIVHGHF